MRAGTAAAAALAVVATLAVLLAIATTPASRSNDASVALRRPTIHVAPAPAYDDDDPSSNTIATTASLTLSPPNDNNNNNNNNNNDNNDKADSAHEEIEPTLHNLGVFNASTEQHGCDATPLARQTPLQRANCGSTYPLPDPSAHVKVAFSGIRWNHQTRITGERHATTWVYLAGCSGSNHMCPLSPKCRFVRTGDEVSRQAGLADADVVVTTVYESHDFERRIAPRREPIVANNTNRKPFRVLYWREASWPHLPRDRQRVFDVEMGVHYGKSHILNPAFATRPVDILPPGSSARTRTEVTGHTRFGISIMSDCHPSSQRDAYLHHLSFYLGPDLVHRYGACGTHSLPRGPEAAATISTYLFYFAFENTIQSGYVTEKLFNVLRLPVVPVVYATPDVPAITSTKSYIHAKDFASPRELASYLLRLAANPTEYAAYHAWRSVPQPFDDGFLAYVAEHVPGPRETEPLRARFPTEHPFIIQRRAACCRLCNLPYLAQGVQRRVSSASAGDDFPTYVDVPWSPERIAATFFGQKGLGIPSNASPLPRPASLPSFLAPP